MKHMLEREKKAHTMRWLGAFAILSLALAACAPAAPAATDTAVPSDTPAVTDTTAPVTTDTLAVTDTPAMTDTPAATSAMTDTPAATSATMEATATGPGYGSGGATNTPGPVVVNISQNTSLGNILVDGAGMTLYKYANDTSGTSTCNAACLANWPPLLATSAVTAGTGLNASDFSTAMTTDGRTMVTYKGSPLYYFKNDTKPGDTNGNGTGGVWSVVAP